MIKTDEIMRLLLGYHFYISRIAIGKPEECCRRVEATLFNHINCYEYRMPAKTVNPHSKYHHFDLFLLFFVHISIQGTKYNSKPSEITALESRVEIL
jgi:hypothetical protein